MKYYFFHGNKPEKKNLTSLNANFIDSMKSQCEFTEYEVDFKDSQKANKLVHAISTPVRFGPKLFVDEPGNMISNRKPMRSDNKTKIVSHTIEYRIKKVM